MSKVGSRLVAWRAFMGVAAAGSLALPAHAKLDVALDRQYAGVYSNACSDTTALRVKFYDDVMAVERAGKTVQANKVRGSKTHPTAGADADFRLVVTGDVRGADGLTFVLHHNANGLFATVEGGAAALAPLGPGIVGQTLRHCDPNRNVLPGAAPSATGPQHPEQLLRDKRFGVVWRAALGPLASERWIARLSGPAPQPRTVTVDGADALLGSLCKPHDCAENNLVLLYWVDQGRVVALVQRRGHKTLLGGPSPSQARELEALWQKEWRAGR